MKRLPMWAAFLILVAILASHGQGASQATTPAIPAAQRGGRSAAQGGASASTPAPPQQGGRGAALPLDPTLDAVKIDPKHYSVVYENDHVRVLKAVYGPHEKSPAHYHSGGVVIDPGDGAIHPAAALTHAPQNNTDKEEVIVIVEMKDAPRK